MVWVHAVSVGEVLAVQKLLQGLLARFPKTELVLTTVTPTGQKIAKDWEEDRLSVCYFPFDLSRVCRRFFDCLHPRCVLLVETEIWPNLLREARRAGVPVGLVNARLSRASFRRYQRFRVLFRSLFESLDFVLAQTAEDAHRFERLGVPQERISILGNMKFDNVSLSDAPDRDALRRRWHFDSSDRILIAGSTHPGEEEKILKVFTELRKKSSALKMILAPRHIERTAQVVRQIQRLGLKPQTASKIDQVEAFDVLVLDRLGILKTLYGLADWVFVGGSLIPRGGQNPIEAAIFKRPILHGPHVFNFEKIYQALDQEGGSLLVRDEGELLQTLSRLLEDETACEKLGEKAFACLSHFQGATQRHLDWIQGFLIPGYQERTPDVQIHEKLFPSIGGRA